MRKLLILTAATILTMVFGFSGTVWAGNPVICDELGLGAHPEPCHTNLALLLSNDSNVTKTLLSGPLFASDHDTLAADEVFPSTDPNINDDGVIGVTLLHSQHYVVEIEFINPGDDDESNGSCWPMCSAPTLISTRSRRMITNSKLYHWMGIVTAPV